MTNVIKQSGVLPWQATNISAAPSRSGVYVLRTATEIASIIYIGSSDNLERRLNEHLLLGDVPGVSFFDWYETSSIEDARNIEKQWIANVLNKIKEF